MLTLWVMSWTGAELEEMTDQGSCEGWVAKTYSCLPDITPTQWPPLPKSLSLPRLGWAYDQPCYVVLTVKTNLQWSHCLFLAIWYDFLALQWKKTALIHTVIVTCWTLLPFSQGWWRFLIQERVDTVMCIVMTSSLTQPGRLGRCLFYVSWPGCGKTCPRQSHGWHPWQPRRICLGLVFLGRWSVPEVDA